MGEVCKNLFLRDSAGKRHFLVTIPNDKKAPLKILQQKLGTSRLSFASETRLARYLKLHKGEVTPFGILNDEGRHGRAAGMHRQLKVLLERAKIGSQHQPVAAGCIEVCVYFGKSTGRRRGQQFSAQHGFFDLNDVAERCKRGQKVCVYRGNALKPSPFEHFVLRFCQCQPGKRTNQSWLWRKTQVTCKEGVRKYRMPTRLPCCVRKDGW